VHADAVAVREVVTNGVVAVGCRAGVWEIQMSWWKTALIYIGKKALEIAGDELAKKGASKPK
jgi:hypothetical protein